MKSVYAPIAQLDRVTGYEPVGRGFESLSAYQKFQIPIRVSGIFYLRWKGLERLNATVRGTVAADGSTEANNYLRKAQMQTSPFRRTTKRSLEFPFGVRRPMDSNNPSVSLFGCQLPLHKGAFVLCKNFAAFHS